MVNGSDAGRLLRIKDGWSRGDFVTAAKAALLSEEASATVDDSKVKLYLQGGDEVLDLDELVTDDVVMVAFTGSLRLPHWSQRRTRVCNRTT